MMLCRGICFGIASLQIHTTYSQPHAHYVLNIQKVRFPHTNESHTEHIPKLENRIDREMVNRLWEETWII